jgi:hypothetical protein
MDADADPGREDQPASVEVRDAPFALPLFTVFSLVGE